MSSLADLRSRALTRVFWTSTKIAAEASTADSSSTASTVMNRLPPAPPCSSGISIPMSPSSKSLGIRTASRAVGRRWSPASTLLLRRPYEHVADTAERAEHARGLVGHVDDLVVLA